MPIKLPLSLRRQRITGKEDKTQQQQQPFPLDTLNTQRLGGAEPLPLLSEHDSSSSAAAAVVAQQLHTTAQPENTSINVPSTESEISSTPTGNKKTREPHQIRLKRFRFYQGGVRPCHAKLVRIIGRCGFVAKGVVYGIIGVLIITNVTGDYTPNGSEGNESPQGAFLLLGGIPTIGRSVLVVMAVGLFTYLVWRFWEGVCGQGLDAMLSKRTNFFRYRLSPMVSGFVYLAYLYYLVQMIYQTHEQQQQTASSKEFPASWTDTQVGSAFIGVFGVAFLIAFATQMINAITGNFIPDLKTSEATTRRCRWEACIVHTAGRIGFGGRAAVFGTLSGFFWDSLATRNESGKQNMVAAAIHKIQGHAGGAFFLVLLGISLMIYALFAISNAYYKYFPTPPPSRIPLYVLAQDDNLLPVEDPSHQCSSDEQSTAWWKKLLGRVHPSTKQDLNKSPSNDEGPSN